LELEPGLLADFQNELKHRNFAQLLVRIFDLVHLAVQSPELEMRYNHLPDLDAVVQQVGREVMRDLNLESRPTSETVNVFIASEVDEVGGHTRNIVDLIRNSRRRSLVILTDLFDRYAEGTHQLGKVAHWLGAAVCVLPKMSLIDKTRNLMRILNSLDMAAVGILAHHEDVVAYAACNDLLDVPQVFIHHADHNPTLGATISHYTHVDMFPGNLAMCNDAGYVSPDYMPVLAARRFIDCRAGLPLNTGTVGRFSKFTVDGPLNYADIVVGVLNATGAKHVHIGTIPDDYLRYLEGRLIAYGIDPARFVYLGNVDDIQSALVEQQVQAYISSAPVGGGKSYVEVLALGMPVLLYCGANSDKRIIAHYSDVSSYGDHPRWSSIEELILNLNRLDVEQECLRSRHIYVERFSESDFHRVMRQYF